MDKRCKKSWGLVLVEPFNQYFLQILNSSPINWFQIKSKRPDEEFNYFRNPQSYRNIQRILLKSENNWNLRHNLSDMLAVLQTQRKWSLKISLNQFSSSLCNQSRRRNQRKWGNCEINNQNAD